MPVDAVLKTMDSASSTALFTSSPVAMAGTGAPGRTVTPEPTRPTLTPPSSTLPANFFTAPGGAITTSKVSPPSTRFSICGVVLNVIFTV